MILSRIYAATCKTSEILSIVCVFHVLSWYFNFDIDRIQRNWNPGSSMGSPEVSNTVKVTDGSRTLPHCDVAFIYVIVV